MRPRYALVIAFVLLAICSIRARDPAFEVASVKVSRSDAPATSRFALGPGDAYAPGNLFVATNQSLIVYLRFAYKLGEHDPRLAMPPMWIFDERFDIEARAPGNPSKDTMRLMMRSLLAERFGLRVHTEHRTQPVFDLILAMHGQPDRNCNAMPAAHPARRRSACKSR